MIPEPWNTILHFLLGGGALRAWQKVFSVQPKTIQPCTTSIQRVGRGLPWDEQIAIHPLKDGRIEMRFLRLPPK